jgi:hypothetical protein
MTLAHAGCGPTRGGASSLWPLSVRTYMPLTGGLGGPEDEVAACEPRGWLMAAIHAGLGGMRPLTVIHAGRGGVVRRCHLASEIMDLNRALLGHCWTGEYGPTACRQHGCQLLAWLTSLRTQPAGSPMLVEQLPPLGSTMRGLAASQPLFPRASTTCRILGASCWTARTSMPPTCRTAWSDHGLDFRSFQDPATCKGRAARCGSLEASALSVRTGDNNRVPMLKPLDALAGHRSPLPPTSSISS